jgi:hypothetical protein
MNLLKRSPERYRYAGLLEHKDVSGIGNPERRNDISLSPRRKMRECTSGYGMTDSSHSSP